MTDRCSNTPLILLAGLRASGKSTVGPLLAAELAVPFHDLDHSTAALLHEGGGLLSVAELFKSRGELAFRDAECKAFSHMLIESTHTGAIVLALGGGTLMQAEAQRRLIAHRAEFSHSMCLILLDPSVETMRARLKADGGDRPSLTGVGVIEEVAAIAAQRLTVYRSFADAIITESNSPAATTAACFSAVRAFRANHAAS